MEINGRNEIPAPLPAVWGALNNPDVLRRCVPGCESLEKISDVEYKATLSTKIGPVRTRFTGGVILTDVKAPYGYTIIGEGKAGGLGFAKGNVKVRLESVNGVTVLTYGAEAALGGKFAQLGSRVVKAAAQEMADRFFTSFANEFGRPTTGAQEVASPSVVIPVANKTVDSGITAVPRAAPTWMSRSRGVPAWAWAAIAAIALFAVGIVVSDQS